MTHTTRAHGPDATDETCQGKRFTDEVLQYRLRKKSIATPTMSVAEAVAFFTEPAIAKILKGLEVGLGYPTPASRSTLRGGERQRRSSPPSWVRPVTRYVLESRPPGT